jgi:hypothetical protein
MGRDAARNATSKVQCLIIASAESLAKGSGRCRTRPGLRHLRRSQCSYSGLRKIRFKSISRSNPSRPSGNCPTGSTACACRRDGFGEGDVVQDCQASGSSERCRQRLQLEHLVHEREWMAAQVALLRSGFGACQHGGLCRGSTKGC